jgi:ribose transport system substrate-binding protein
MKTVKIVLILVAIIIVAAIVFFIQKSNKDGKSDKYRIAFVVPTLDNPFFIDMTDGAKKKAEELGNIELIIQATQRADDAIGQNQIVENLITQKVDLICIVPISSDGIIPVIKKANSANIPIVNVDNKINMVLAEKEGAIIASYIGSDNFDGGVLAGKYIVEKLGGKGKVAILEGVSGNDAAINRKAGFLHAIKDYPDIIVVASQVGNWSREQAFRLFQNILQANPDLNALFACNDEMALGAYSALTQSRILKERIIIVGFDAIDEAVQAVKEGNIDATVAQQPSKMGEDAINIAQKILSNESFKKENSTDLILIK